MATQEENPAYVYFLFYPEANIFKVGKANVVSNRILTLSDNYDFDFSKSYYIEVPNETISLKIEKTIHLWFKEYNITTLVKKDGYTEFYSMDIFMEVKKFIGRFFEYILEYKKFDDSIEVLVEEKKKKMRKSNPFIENEVSFSEFECVLEAIKSYGLDSTSKINIPIRQNTKENALLVVTCVYFSSIRLKELIEFKFKDLKDWINYRTIQVGDKNYTINMSQMLEDRLRDILDFSQMDDSDYIISKGQKNRKNGMIMNVYTTQLHGIFDKLGFDKLRLRNFYNTTPIF